MKKIISLFFIFFFVFNLYAQNQEVCSFSGKVTDLQTGMPIEGASVAIKGTNIGEFTDSTGVFNFCHLKEQEYIFLVNYIGYQTAIVRILINNDTISDIRLKPIAVNLDAVEIVSSSIEKTLYKVQPFTSFNKILNTIEGTATMNIGGEISKPVIRGFSANRVAVINRGIVQQNQQWGADHGLALNSLDISRFDIYKGPNSLLMGSGTTTAIDIRPEGFGVTNGLKGEVQLLGASNNDLYKIGVNTRWQNDKWFLQGAYEYKDYADYRLPVSETTYGSEIIEFIDKRLPNSAGKEYSLSGTVGFREKNLTSYFNIANNYQKSGLFELSEEHDHDHNHEGEEHDHDHEHDEADTSHRNLSLPYATANHFSVTNNTEWKTSSFRMLMNTGYQYNHRREYEHFHEHYEGQAAPVTDDDIAVDFKLRTYSTNARLYFDENKKWTKTIGMNFEYQQNRIGGFEYFLPRYNQVTGGLSFVMNTKPYEQDWAFSVGARYDVGHIDVTGYYDNILADYLLQQGYNQDIIQQFAQRAYGINHNYGNWSASAGFEYRPIALDRNFSLKVNAGKIFRFPSANELASNGLHHAAFRYEMGNPDLNPENGYTFDIDLSYNNIHNTGFSIGFSPYLNYYSNFIFLQPVAELAVNLYDDEKAYHYSQAKAIFGGGEYQLSWDWSNKLLISTKGSLVLNKNLDDHIPLPFTPPFTMDNEISYRINHRKGKVSHYQFSVSHRWYADQNRVGFGEERTSGTNLFGAAAETQLRFNPHLSLIVNLQVQNIFNTNYLNHLSLYRRLNIPEQGRNFQLYIKIPFNG